MKQKIVNYSGVFHLPFNDTTLALINSCRSIYNSNEEGWFSFVAVSFDEEGNVYFEKQFHN